MKSFVATLATATTHAAVTVECFLPRRATGTAMVILPGGGYGFLSPREGVAFAQRFSAEGIVCFVVSYRLGAHGAHFPAMVEDALAAVETVRRRADEFGVDPRRVGIIGSSAGGHCAALALTGWRAYQSDIALRPAFGILCYPVITATTPSLHEQTIRHCLGPGFDNPDLRTRVSAECQVSADTPPCFLWHTAQDTVVPIENTLRFAAALRAHNVPFELHCYHHGAHGLALDTDIPWVEQALRWVARTLDSEKQSPP